jgi:hypothetical protein
MRKPLRHDHPGPLARWRARAAQRRGQRLLADRERRRLASSLRRAASCVSTPSRHTVLLPDRAAAVRDELLELALILEHSGDLDASWVSAVHKLLTDGCESPLYNSEIHISELRATLYYLRNAHRVQPASLG